MSRNLQSIAPTIAQYPSYDELLANSEQVPLSEFQSLNANEMPRFADGLFDLPPGPGLQLKIEKNHQKITISTNGHFIFNCFTPKTKTTIRFLRERKTGSEKTQK